jgi:hypothetical protein
VAEIVTVTVQGEELAVAPGGSLTFGRSLDCTVCLDPDDRGISRLAGSVDGAGGEWFVTNRSATRPLAVVDPLGFRTVLAPGRRMAVDERLSVVVEGQVRRHELVVATPGAPSTTLDEPGEGIETEMGHGVVYSDDDRLALVALFAGYLEPFPRHDPRPRSYADAAERLGWPRTTLVKRIEYLRTRLLRAGVPNLQGDRALEALAEHVIATGEINRTDLGLIPGRKG